MSYMKAARELYQPTIGSMTSNLPTMGLALNEACRALADNCTLPRIDELAARLDTAKASLSHLRKAVIREKEHESHK